MNVLEELHQMADLQECGRAFIEIGQLREIADRIESEWMELPRDKDGEVIHVGDVLLPTERTTQNMVGSIFVVAAVSDNSLYDANGRCVYPEWTKHRNQDTWERIEADADKSPCEYYDRENDDCSQCVAYSDVSCDKKQRIDLVRRCKAMAGVRDE